MRASYIVLVAVATVLASVSSISEATNLGQVQLSGVASNEAVSASTNRFLRKRTIDADEEDADDEERSIDLLAEKLSGLVGTLKSVNKKSMIEAMAHLQQLGLPWKDREAILTFISLDAASRAAVLQKIAGK
ncbi:hypothetical protein PF005_g24065 [Phytophthora fragariae]|uniref:RxLR effector protein n=1 Tax=Phytophthora fragariae TaxID=53985 RepID=A0A6A3DXM4_9STRA|nr:hypothetical protein PF003_g24603 [Phytophthora fragariae]KAE8924896.1 hypothetical protein PF009_g24880 [Phytophthora fragariae]KAE8977805.1 hypothetical protein PF011_g23502 [Phytophthora fragariae]KAE9075903.1 hypothetical protein PF010_g24118 [Phytophthora fragariae]KAE9076604.1 hypothetical protein PF007_g24567 [Phytophthora fragariae]